MLNNAINIADNYKDHKKKIFFLNLEQEQDDIIDRIVDCSNKTPEQFYNDYIATQKITVLDTSYVPSDINKIEEWINFICSQLDVGVIFIDYIQLIDDIKNKYQSEYLKYKSISKRLLELAKNNKISIILGSQFNTSDKQEDTLTTDSIRESKDIGYYASLILGIKTKKDNEKRVIFNMKNRSGGKIGSSATFSFSKEGKINKEVRE